MSLCRFSVPLLLRPQSLAVQCTARLCAREMNPRLQLLGARSMTVDRYATGAVVYLKLRVSLRMIR
jgi:hypothetical protein